MRHQVKNNLPTGSPYSLPVRLGSNIVLNRNSSEQFLRNFGSYPCEVIEVETEAKTSVSFDGEKVVAKRVDPIFIKDGELSTNPAGVKLPMYQVMRGQEVEEDEQYEPIKTYIAGMVLQGDLTDDEWAEVIGMYPKWEDYPDGHELKENLLLVHNNKLYKVIEGKTHNKQSDWKPGIAGSLFTEVAPEGVIPVWYQPEGSHDAWPVGSKVEHPEGGPIWLCVEGDANDLNVWEPGVFGWEQVEE